MKTFSISIFLLAAFGTTLTAGIGQIFLNESFDEGLLQDQNLPNSAQWFGSFNNLSIVGQDGDFSLENAPVSMVRRHAVAYFAPPGAPLVLTPQNPGLRLRFEITPTTHEPEPDFNVLRFGLLHSGSSRITQDNTNPDLSINGGYGIYLRPSDLLVQVRQRLTGSGPLFSSLNPRIWSRVLASDLPLRPFSLRKGVKYYFECLIERQTNGDLRFTVSISDGDNVDSVELNVWGDDLTYEFDTVGFAWGSSFGNGLIHSVQVSQF